MLVDSENSFRQDANGILTQNLFDIIANRSCEKLVCTSDAQIQLDNLPDAQGVEGAVWPAFEGETLQSIYGYLGALGANLGLCYTYYTDLANMQRLGFPSLFRHANAQAVEACKNDYLKYSVAHLNGELEIDDMVYQVKLLDTLDIHGYFLDFSRQPNYWDHLDEYVCKIKSLRSVTGKPIIVNLELDREKIAEDPIQFRLDMALLAGDDLGTTIGIEGLDIDDFRQFFPLFLRLEKTLGRRFCYGLKKGGCIEKANLSRIVAALKDDVSIIRLQGKWDIDTSIQIAFEFQN